MDIILLLHSISFYDSKSFYMWILGMTSATLRETSVQSYLPSNMRAKVNAVFNVFMALSIIIFQIIAGYLGDRIGYRKVVVLLASFSLLAIFILIVKPTEENRKIYEATRVSDI